MNFFFLLICCFAVLFEVVTVSYCGNFLCPDRSFTSLQLGFGKECSEHCGNVHHQLDPLPDLLTRDDYNVKMKKLF